MLPTVSTRSDAPLALHQRERVLEMPRDVKKQRRVVQCCAGQGGPKFAMQILGPRLHISHPLRNGVSTPEFRRPNQVRASCK